MSTATKQISRIPLKPVRIKWHCPQCEDGELVVQSGISNGAGTVWHHRCETCGFEATDAEQHPRIDYEEDWPEIKF